MIIIPEIEKIVILTPRTGTGSLRRAIAKTYPRAILLYRHMEADGVPAGYDRWEKVGVVRNPVDRLWSLYKFLKKAEFFDHEPAFAARMKASVDRPFSDWVLNNEVPFTTPYDSTPKGRFYPLYTVRHPLPENRKSQFMYLRPDLGTSVFRYDQWPDLMQYLGIDEAKPHNVTDKSEPTITDEASAYLKQAMEWDFWHSRAPFSSRKLTLEKESA